MSGDHREPRTKRPASSSEAAGSGATEASGMRTATGGSRWQFGSVQIRIEESESPRHSRHLFAGRGTAQPSRSRRVHRLAARSHGPRRLRRLAVRDSLSFERATLSRDGARILRILAVSGKSSISRTDERRIASFEPRSSVALLPVVSSRGAAARAGRGTEGPSRLASSGFAESASPFQSARVRLHSRQKLACRSVLM